MRRRDMLTQLTELIEAHNVFVRERKSNKIRSLGIALLYLGLSCRKAANVLRFVDVDEASHEAVRQWYHRVKALLRAPPRRCRKAIAIDETKVRVEGMWYYSSSGRRSTRRTKSCHASRSRRRGTGTTPPSRFIRRALQACTNEHADGAGGWWPVAFAGARQDGGAADGSG